MVRVLAVVMAVAFLAIAVQPVVWAQPAPAMDTLIELGRQLGPLRVGFTLDQARTAMGRPPDSSGVATNTSSPVYEWILEPPQFSARSYLIAFTRGGALVQIETNATEFKTRGGNGVGGTFDGLVREFGPPVSDEYISGTTSRIVTFAGDTLFVRLSSTGRVLTVGVIR